MPVERIPDEKKYIDWVGDQPYLLTDPVTGKLLKVHIFATTLGFSSCVYAEAFTDEKISSFIAGTTHALDYYGAVPAYLVPDNLKTAVTKHTRDELVLTETVRYKKFLFWKTGKVKDRQLDAVSLNPHSTITGLEHIIIGK